MKARTPRRRSERRVSAGGVVYRVENGLIEAALCGRLKPLKWSLPKGTPNKSESLEETALREVQEETGLEVRIEAPIGNISYWFVDPESRTNCEKTVHFFLMSQTGGSTDLHDFEFDRVQWFPWDGALRSLTYPSEVDVLQRALKLIRAREPQETGSHGKGMAVGGDACD